MLPFDTRPPPDEETGGAPSGPIQGIRLAGEQEILERNLSDQLSKQLLNSGLFTQGQVMRHGRVLWAGLRAFAVANKITFAELQRRREWGYALALAEESYELACRYLKEIKRQPKGERDIKLVKLLESYSDRKPMEVSRFQYLLSEVERDPRSMPETVEELERWVSGRSDAGGESFVAADNSMSEILKSATAQGASLCRYISTQPVFRLSDKPFGSEDIRLVGLEGETFVSKRRARGARKPGALPEEFENTRTIADRIGQRAIQAPGLSQPIGLQIAQARALIESKDETFLLTDFVPGETLDDFLSRLTPNKRRPYLLALRSIFEVLFDAGIVWKSPHLRNVAVTQTLDGRVVLTLLDFEGSAIEDDPQSITENLKQEFMLKVWRSASVLPEQERNMLTEGCMKARERHLLKKRSTSAAWR